MSNSVQLYTNIATAQSSFSFPFSYLEAVDITAYVDGVSVFENNASTGTAVGGNTYVVSFSAPDSTTLNFSPAVPAGSDVRIQRNTDLTTKAVDFADGAVLTEIALDTAIDQVFFGSQEAIDKANDSITVDTDDKWDAQNKVIKNVANPVNNTDAVNKQFITTNLPNINTVAGIAADVTTVAGISADVTAVAAIDTETTTVSGIASDVTTVSGIAADVTTVAADGTDIGVVAGISSDVSTVSGISTDVTTVSGISADVTAVAADATDIGTVSTNIANVNTVAGISGNVTTVAGISSDVTAVAADATDIGTVGANIANVNTVAGISGNVTTVAGISSDVTAVAADATDIGTVSTNIANVNTVAGISADVSTVAADGTDIGVVAGISSDVSTVSGISGNVTTVAGISSDVTTVATYYTDLQTVAADISSVITAANDLNEAVSEIDTVANSITNVDLVGADIANVNTVASNLTDINAFADTYFIAATAPSSPTTGDLWFDTTTDTMKVYGSSGWQNAGSSVNGTANRVSYTATSGQTSFAATYDAGYIDVYLNGIKLIDGTDFTATNGTSVVLASGAALNDTVDIVAYGTFQLSSFSIDDANDVSVASATNGQYLQYNGTNWVGASVSTPTLTSLGLDNHDLVDVDASGNVSLGSSSISFGTSAWSIVLDGTDLDFQYNGTTVFKLSSAGAVVAADNITAYGTP